MVYILFIALFMLTVIAFIASNRILIAPWVIVCGVFLISTFFATIQKNSWGYVYHPIVIIVIISALLVFGIGALLAQKLLEQSSIKPKFAVDTGPPLIEVNSGYMYGLLILLGLFSAYYLYRYYLMGVAYGGSGSIFSMMRQIREASLAGQTAGRLAGHIYFFVSACSNVFLFLLIQNCVFHFEKRKLFWFLFLVPIVLKLLMAMIGGGRTEFIYITIFIFVASFTCYLTKKQWNPITSVFLIWVGLGGFIALLIVFRYLGLMKDSGTGWNFLDYISLYVGMSIPSFDEFLVNGRPESLLIGDHTLFPIYSVLKTLGFDVPNLYAPYDFVTMPGGASGNVYTALRRYIEDFGYIGMYIVVLLLGFLFSSVFFYIKKSRNIGMPLLLYSVFCYPIFEFSIEERFFMNVISTSTIYLLIYYGVLYYFVIYKSMKKDRWLKI